MGVVEISRCPIGQDYVKMESVLDLDTLVREGPHRFDDINIMFQHHDEGLNWCRYHLNRNVWLMLVGFH